MTDKIIRVLLVEADEDDVTTIFMVLDVLGFDVTRVSSGLEALDAISFDTPDVILLDLLMTLTDGFDFLHRYHGPVPIVVMNAWGNMEDLPRQPYAIVTKPVSMTEVEPILRAAAKSWKH